MTRESRDLSLALTGVVIGGPMAAFFAYTAAALSCAMSFSHPEFALGILLAIFTACALGWNALWSALALASLAPLTPSSWRQALVKAANICGTQRARRIMARSVTSCALGATVWGAGISAAVADTPQGPTATDPASLTWIWEASNSPSQAPSPSSGGTQTQLSGTAEGADPQAHTAPPSTADPQPQPGNAQQTAAPHTAQSASSQSTTSTPNTRSSTPDTPDALSSAGTSVPTPKENTSGGSGQPSQPQAQSQSQARATSPTGHAPDTSDAPAARQATHVVLPGDTLWDIARSHLEPGATAQQISERWQQIYALNKDLIGEDPHLIHPGQTLTLPKG